MCGSRPSLTLNLSLSRPPPQEARTLLEADRATLFLLDEAKGELWSKVAEGVDGTIRVPVSAGIVGAVARSAALVNIPDAYKVTPSRTPCYLTRP